MAVEVMDDFELEKIRAEIQQEKQMKEMLEQSASELRATVEELEKRYDSIDNEGPNASDKNRPDEPGSGELDWNEWKTRYETQTEINEQLERQILMLQNKVQEAKQNLKDEDLAELGFKPGKGILKQGGSEGERNGERSEERMTDKGIQVDRTRSNLNVTKSTKPDAESMHNPTDNENKPNPEDTKKSFEGKSKPDRTNKVQIKPDSYLPDKSKQGELKEAHEGKSKLERTIKVRTKPGSYLPARAHVAGRESASRSSIASKAASRSSSESKPGTAMTKTTGITINIAISPRPGDLAGKTPRDLKNFDDLSDANPYMIRMLEKEKNVLTNQMRDLEWRLDQESKANKYMVRSLEREKQMLQGQIRDIEWRLDQESKAYHKANEERKNYSLEINSTKGSINELATRSKLNSSRDQLDTIPGSRTPRSMGSRVSLKDDENSPSHSPRRSTIKTIRNTNYRSLRNLETEIRNIPEDQRILDPKRGPIRKAAAVKSLPSLETT